MRPSTSENFEDVYLRTSFLKKMKTEKKEVFEAYMSHHLWTINVQSGKFFSKNATHFKTIGFGIQDIKSFCMFQLWVFLECHSLFVNAKAMDAFLNLRKKKYPDRTGYPTEKEILAKDRSNFMSFIAQRFSVFIRVAKQKKRNVRGAKEVSSFYIKTDKSVSVPRDLIALNHELYGYEKVGAKEYRELKKRLGKKLKNEDFVLDKKEYLYIYSDPPITSLEALSTVHNPDNSMYFWRPDMLAEYEENLISKEASHERLKNYKKASKNQKIEMLMARKKELTPEDSRVIMLIDQKLMELNGV